MKSLTAIIILASSVLAAAVPVELEIRAQNQVFASSQANADKTRDGVRSRDIYRLYQGNGATWPKMSDWVSFQEMFDTNAALMKKACFNQGLQGYDTTDEEIGWLYWAIQGVAKATKVDHRFILAVIMQESGGCVRIYATAVDHPNPGLMQSHAGTFNCNTGTDKAPRGQMKTPCPWADIYGMISDGTGGTAQGDGLAGCLNKAVTAATNLGMQNMNGGNAQVFYQAARMYNSGRVDYNDLNNNSPGTTKCYANDIANRLTGWTRAENLCKKPRSEKQYSLQAQSEMGTKDE